MSIQSEITRIAGNVSDSLDAVADKGVTVPSGSNSDDLAGLIALIPTASGEDGYVWQDAQGYIHLSDEQGTQPIMDSLTVSASGTYTPQSGHAYSSVTVPSGSATTPATSVTANPSISVNSSGLITATASATKSVTPTVSGGYVTSGTAGTITVSGSNTSQLSTQGATTITPTESEQTAVASGKYTTGVVKVGAISSEYVGSDIARHDSTDAQVSGNTVIFPAGYYEQMAGAQVASGTAGTPTATKGTVSNASVTVTPSVTNTTGYITGSTKTGTAVTVTASELVAGNTITADDSGNWNVTNAQTMVIPSGTAGTPTATKGSVSNHSISVTPSVTNTSGWINGSTKTGTAVTVTASELVSGSQNITANANNIDVTNLASVNVNVQPSYTATLTNSGASGAVYVKYSGTSYYTSGQTISYHAGETLSCYVVQGNDNRLYVDGVQVAGGSQQGVSNYAYTLPSADIEISFSTGMTSASMSITTLSSVNLITKTITANGTYDAEDDDADGYSSVTVNVSGGGTTPAEKKQINFIDYDGTILYSYTSAEWANVTALPSNPSHTGLTSQGWNWTKNKIDEQLTACPTGDIWVGQMYVTTSGNTEIDVEMLNGRLNPILTIAVNGTISVDWGDNTTPNTVTGTSLTTRQAVSHTYASAGSYTIKISVTTGSFSFYGGSSSYELLRKSSTLSQNRVYSSCVKAIRIGNGIAVIGDYAFYNCYCLKSITMPNTITTFGNYSLTECYALSSLTIPSSVTSIGTYAMSMCYSLTTVSTATGITSVASYAFNLCNILESITIPKGVTSIGEYAFNTAKCLKSIAIPNTVTTLNNYAFTGCHTAPSITIPSSVTSIGNSAFSSCYGVAVYHIQATTPPTLGTTVFNNIVSDCKIYVPTASLSDYQTAWSTYASYLVGE